MEIKNIERLSPLSFLWVLVVFVLTGCGKNDPSYDNPEQKNPEFSYEVVCYYCDISYVDQNQQTNSVRNIRGSWNYKFDKNLIAELKISIKTTISSHQKIEVYILKDGEVIFGDLGYNIAELSYLTSTGKGSARFGSYANPANNNNDGSGGGSTTPPKSTVCGAKNKTGGYCQRKVAGGGRCWQHR